MLQQLIRCIVVRLVVLLSAVFIIPAGAATMVFQNGLNGYTGTRDSTIGMYWGGELSSGGASTAMFYGVPWGGGKCPGLLAFDGIFGTGADQFNPAWEISAATLKVFVYSKVVVTGSNYIQVWPMVTPWGEGTSVSFGATEGASTGNHRYYHSSGSYAVGDFWGVGGVATNGPVNGVDFNVDGTNATQRTAVFTGTLNDWGPAAEWMTFDVTAIVRAWKDGTIANNGFYGYSNGYWQGVQWYSSEYADDPGLRPMLVIDYEPSGCGAPGMPYPAGDISGPDGVPDCYVDVYDLVAMARQWMDCTMPGTAGCTQFDPVGESPGCGQWGYFSGDVNADCIVDMNDFAAMAMAWLACTDPLNSACTAAMPQFNPNGGAIACPTLVTVTCGIPGDTIRYTLDGTAPSETHGTEIASGTTVLVSPGQTLSARAWADNFLPGSMKTATYPPAPPAATPQFSPDSIMIDQAVPVTVTCPTADAMIHYTLDGTTPSQDHGTTVASGDSVLVAPGQTLSAIALADGFLPSDVKDVLYPQHGDFYAPSPTSPLVVDVRDTGAAGNGVTNDTAAIQAAVDMVAGTGGTVWVPVGTYMIDAQTCVNLGSRTTFHMDNAAVLKAIPNDVGLYALIKIASKTDVNVVGGTIQGERHEHLAEDGEWGMGIWIAGSSNVYIDGVTARACWGDGFYQAGYGGRSYNVNIYSVIADDNRRQGLSVENVDGMAIRDSIFKNTFGTWPMCGIDLEPFQPDQATINLLVTNNRFENNYTGFVLAGGSLTNVIHNIAVVGNVMVNNTMGVRTKHAGPAIFVFSNTIINNTLDGIRIENATGGTYSNNTISISPAVTGDHAAIRLMDGATSNTGTGNTNSGYPTKVLDLVGGNTIN